MSQLVELARIRLGNPIGLQATESPELRAWQKEVERLINEEAERVYRQMILYGTGISGGIDVPAR